MADELGAAKMSLTSGKAAVAGYVNSSKL